MALFTYAFQFFQIYDAQRRRLKDNLTSEGAPEFNLSNLPAEQPLQVRRSRVDVMVTIFCNFLPIFRRKRCFSKIHNVMYDQFFSKTSSSLSKKRKYFFKSFRRQFKKIITSVPETYHKVFKSLWTFYFLKFPGSVTRRFRNDIANPQMLGESQVVLG
jgi:hypothetical protein